MVDLTAGTCEDLARIGALCLGGFIFALYLLLVTRSSIYFHYPRGRHRPRQPLGFARATVREIGARSGITVEGDIRLMRITNSQEIDLQFRPTDIHNNPTDDYEHGSARWKVLSGDASLVEITQDPNLELAATIRATGLNGVVQIGCTVDGDPGDGRDEISASGPLEIVSSRARSGQITGFTVREQQEAAAVPDLPPASTAPPSTPAPRADLGNPLASPVTAPSATAPVVDSGIAQALRFTWARGQCGDIPATDNLFPCFAVYRDSQALTKETAETTVYCEHADFVKLPMHVNDIGDLLEFRAFLSREKAGGNPVAPSDAPVTEAPTAVVVDGSAPSSFPMMGGAKVVESSNPALVPAGSEQDRGGS